MFICRNESTTNALPSPAPEQRLQTPGLLHHRGPPLLGSTSRASRFPSYTSLPQSSCGPPHGRRQKPCPAPRLQRLVRTKAHHALQTSPKYHTLEYTATKAAWADRLIYSMQARLDVAASTLPLSPPLERHAGAGVVPPAEATPVAHPAHHSSEELAFAGWVKSSGNLSLSRLCHQKRTTAPHVPGQQVHLHRLAQRPRPAQHPHAACPTPPPTL